MFAFIFSVSKAWIPSSLPNGHFDFGPPSQNVCTNAVNIWHISMNEFWNLEIFERVQPTNLENIAKNVDVLKLSGPLPKACQIFSNVILTSALSILLIFSKNLQSKPIQTTISEHFFGTRAMDTNSNNISSSNYCFLFEKCAREAASLGAIGHDGSHSFSNRTTPFFLTIFGTVFFWK